MSEVQEAYKHYLSTLKATKPVLYKKYKAHLRQVHNIKV